jgi:hypothetical protein
MFYRLLHHRVSELTDSVQITGNVHRRCRAQTTLPPPSGELQNFCVTHGGVMKWAVSPGRTLPPNAFKATSFFIKTAAGPAAADVRHLTDGNLALEHSSNGSRAQ